MLIEFSKPFDKEFGERIEIELEGTLTLKELIELLALRFSGFKRFSLEDDSSLSAHMMFARNGRILRLSDHLQAGDVIHLFLPGTGG